MGADQMDAAQNSMNNLNLLWLIIEHNKGSIPTKGGPPHDRIAALSERCTVATRNVITLRSAVAPLKRGVRWMMGHKQYCNGIHNFAVIVVFML